MGAVGQPKLIPEGELIGFKKSSKEREEKLKAQLEQLTKRVADAELARQHAESQLKTAKANLEDDDEVRLVRADLVARDEEIQARRTKLEEDLGAFGKREKGIRAKEIASDLKSKGVEVELDSLLGEEDMEKKSKDILVDFLAKENEKLKSQSPSNPSPEHVFDGGAGGVLKKGVWQMTNEEFAAYEANLKQESLSRK